MLIWLTFTHFQWMPLQNPYSIRSIHTCRNKRDTNLGFCIAIEILRFFTSVDMKISLIIVISIAHANRKKSCDYLGISVIICIAAAVWTLEQVILVFYIPSFQGSVSKQGHIPAWYQACTVQLTELSCSAISEIFPPVWTSAKYLGISIAMEISIFLVCERA